MFCQALMPVLGLAGEIVGGIKKLEAQQNLVAQVEKLQATAGQLQDLLDKLQQSAQKLANEFARWADLLPPLFSAEVSLDPLLAHVNNAQPNMHQKVKIALALWGHLQQGVEGVAAVDPQPFPEATHHSLQAHITHLQQTTGQIEQMIRLGSWTEVASLIGNLRGFIGAIQSLARQAFNPQI